MSNRVPSIFALTLATAGVLLIGSQVSDRQAIAQGPPGGLGVNVVNTPLPVTVTNPTVPPSSVNVGNPTALATANAHALGIGTPVAFVLDGNTGAPGARTFVVPTGQRLIVEYASGFCLASGTVNGFPPIYDDLQITASTGGISVVHRLNRPINPIPFSNQISSGLAQTQIPFGHLVKIYGDQGTAVTMNLVSCTLAFSGQLVSL
jgi:hypothetical protein